MNKNKIGWIVVITLCLVLIAGGTWYYKAKKTASTPSNYLTGEVARGDVSKRISATGTIQYPSQYNLTFSGKGKITKVNVNVGDKVTAGQVLAEIDSTSANQGVLQAKATLTQAQIKLNQLKAGASQVDILSARSSLLRARNSMDSALSNLQTLQSYKDKDTLNAAIEAAGQGPGASNLVSYRDVSGALAAAIQQAQNSYDSAKVDYDLAKAQYDQKTAGASSADIQNAQLQVDQAQSSLAQAQAALSDTTLVAPVNGLVTAVNGKLGEQPGTSAFIVMMGASSDMQIIVPADEADVGSIAVGQTAEITLSAYPAKTFNGSVTAVAPVGKMQNNVTTFDVTIMAPNTDNLMKPGMSANVSIISAEKKNVVTVPSEAVHGSGNQAYVLMAPTSLAAQPQRRNVSIGLDDGSYAEVVSGLQDGDQVVTGTRTSASSSTGSSTSRSANPFGGGGMRSFGR